MSVEIEEAPAATPVPAPEEAAPAAPSVPAEEPTPADAARAELAEFQRHVLLARRLTLETPGVVNRNLCADGVAQFMTRTRLAPTSRRNSVRIHPSAETKEEAAKAEEDIRAWCGSTLGGDVKDFTDAGLAKRLPALQKAHAEWLVEFRRQSIEHHKSSAGYISLERMAEVFPQLGIPAYEPMLRVEINLSYDYMVPASRVGTSATEFSRRERERLLDAMRRLAGTDSSSDGCRFTDRQSYVQLSVYPQ